MHGGPAAALNGSRPRARGESAELPRPEEKDIAAIRRSGSETERGKIRDAGGEAVLVDVGRLAASRDRRNDIWMAKLIKAIDEGIQFVAKDMHWVSLSENGALKKGARVSLRKLRKEVKTIGDVITCDVKAMPSGKSESDSRRGSEARDVRMCSRFLAGLMIWFSGHR
jgi:chorismate synthase